MRESVAMEAKVLNRRWGIPDATAYTTFFSRPYVEPFSPDQCSWKRPVSLSHCKELVMMRVQTSEVTGSV